MNMVKPVGMTALWLIWISSPYLLEKDPFLKASQSTDGSMKEELKQNKQKRKDICSDECTTQNLVLDIGLKFFFILQFELVIRRVKIYCHGCNVLIPKWFN